MRPEDAHESDERYTGDYYAQGEMTPALRSRIKTRLEAAGDPVSIWLKRRFFTAWLPGPERADGVMLDVGCGAGQLMDRARSLGWRAEGCELSDATARAARRKGYVVYAGDWPGTLPAARYDLVMMSNALEHLVEPGPALEAVTRALRPGGTALITLPNFGCTQAEIFGGTWWALLPPEHVWYYRSDHVTAVLEAAGMLVESVRTRPLATGLLDPSSLRLQWLTWREREGSVAGFGRRCALSFFATGTAAGAVARSPLYTLACRPRG